MSFSKGITHKTVGSFHYKKDKATDRTIRTALSVSFVRNENHFFSIMFIKTYFMKFPVKGVGITTQKRRN